MPNVRPTIQIHEHEEISYEHLGPIEELEALIERSGKNVFRFYRGHLKARQYVGLVQTRRQTIEILPKVYAKSSQNLGFLILLLRLTQTADLEPMGTAGLRRLNGSFLQIWIRHFADRLHSLLTRQYDRQYVEVERTTGFIRGRLRIEDMQSGQETTAGRFPCRYEIYTGDHQMNQILKRCAHLLHRDADDYRAQSRLRACLDLLSDVADRPVRSGEIDRIHLSRLNKAYRSVLRLCRLLLEDSTVGLRSGTVDQLALVFDMNRLFESAVAALLERFRDHLQIEGVPIVSVERQSRVGTLYGEFAMYVDLVIEDVEGSKTLVDTKYKTLSGERSHGGISQSDFYQMHAYATAGENHYDRVLLLYPGKRDVSRQFTSSGVSIFVRTVDLSSFYDPRSGRLNRSSTIQSLQQALDII